MLLKSKLENEKYTNTEVKILVQVLSGMTELGQKMKMLHFVLI
jgi:hypothetical protein